MSGINQQNKPCCLINGISADFLSVYDRSIQYGDGVFETILCRNQRPLLWAEHIERLFESLQRLRISVPNEADLEHDVSTLIHSNAAYASQCVIKIMVSRGKSRRGYQYDPSTPPTRIVTVSEVSPEYSSLLSEQLLNGQLCFCETPVSENPVLAGMKHLNRLDNVLARNEIDDASYMDGIMLNSRHEIIECSTCNIFLVIDKVLTTPSLNTAGVDGVMRAQVLSCARQLGIDVAIGNIERQAVFRASEAFISNSIIGIKSVTAIADQALPADEITRAVFDRLLSTLTDTK